MLIHRFFLFWYHILNQEQLFPVNQNHQNSFFYCSHVPFPNNWEIFFIRKFIYEKKFCVNFDKELQRFLFDVKDRLSSSQRYLLMRPYYWSAQLSQISYSRYSSNIIASLENDLKFGQIISYCPLLFWQPNKPFFLTTYLVFFLWSLFCSMINHFLHCLWNNSYTNFPIFKKFYQLSYLMFLILRTK